MALRSRSRTATPTSGPGRGPASDVRTRHHPRHDRTPRGRHRYASAEELRRRAEVMFADRVGERREAGTGPPGPDGGGLPGAEADGIGADADFGPDDGPAQGDRADVPPATGDRRVRAGLALRERMPVWLQARCGLERRSVVALAVVLVVAAGFAVQHFWAGRTQAVRPPEVVAAPFAERSEQAGPGTSAGAPNAVGSPVPEIVVDVTGKVREPGVHRLPAGSRVADALRAAGGVRSGTDTEGLNRARFLVDGEQVVVGGPAAPGAGQGGTAGGGPVGSAGSVPGAGPAAPVPLNTATVDQLDTLPGVGPVLAQHIVDYRTQHGGFRSVDELREVNGIGERRFADLRNLVRP
ncbi:MULTISPECIES: helix-hairpin-helix domain-containing protein [unclassified Streptomyces]|uniref:helix-hairpin-helix domain-containing protein n=1 Tax=unclassified Streptomyces TaxID=2593676 RepID=UPI0036E03C8B